MAEHKNLSDPNLHEPKGMASAQQGATYIADGTGTGVWQKVFNVNLQGIADAGAAGELVAADGVGGFQLVGDANQVYGEAYVSANASATTIGGADTYQEIGTSVTWGLGHDDNITWTTDHWVIDTTGDYKCSACICYTGGGTGKVYTFAFGVDSGSGIVAQTHGVMRSKTSGATDIKSIPLQSIDRLTAGDLVYLLVKNETDTTGLTITDVNFIVELKEVV